MKESRRIECQKLQRKDRKEKKDIEKLSNQIKELKHQLLELKQTENKSIKENDSIMEIETTTPAGILLGRDSVEKRPNPPEQSDDPSTNIVSVENGESINTASDGILLTSDDASTSKVSKSVEDGPSLSKENVTAEIKSIATKVTLCASKSEVSTGVASSSVNEGM